VAGAAGFWTAELVRVVLVEQFDVNFGNLRCPRADFLQDGFDAQFTFQRRD